MHAARIEREQAEPRRDRSAAGVERPERERALALIENHMVRAHPPRQRGDARILAVSLEDEPDQRSGHVSRERPRPDPRARREGSEPRDDFETPDAGRSDPLEVPAAREAPDAPEVPEPPDPPGPLGPVAPLDPPGPLEPAEPPGA